ncbi:pseudouridine-5'-phosphate glycosidase [Rathayibacter sp. YIM 133350]|uniref:pseudouridine-5'-phosphate glycosidase n=1 Tax=Rathayibacter sp. YIM 133350 TaxID=3131992 RepID=UPI00307EE39E
MVQQRSAVAVSEEVRAAVSDGAPVLALETTILTHGLPRPRNLEVGRQAEALIRQAGVVPATIGVVAGVPTVGLSDDELERLCTVPSVKASVRDLPFLAMRGLDAGTTVAATAFLAHAAGIRAMSTGGLGGVHRGASESFDESADLGTLARTPIALVSAGVKSILDIGATLERIETLNIPIVGYRTNAYPGFYVADSGHRIEHRIESAAEAADVIRARDALGLQAAVLIANPVAAHLQLDPDLHEKVLAAALAATTDQGITGHDITPFLLDYLQRETQGKSLDVNLEVYRGNVELGAQVALALAARD